MIQEKKSSGARQWSLAAWLLERFRPQARRTSHLRLLERLSLAPRQSVALIEADGRRFLVASGPEGSPALYPLDVAPASARMGRGRVSW